MSDKRLFWISKCPDCEGEGFDMSDEPAYGDSTQSVPIACSECNGTGEIREEVKVTADDGEAINDAWLKSVGFARIMQAASHNHMSVTIGQVDITRWLPHREQMASWSVSCEGRKPEYLPMCLWPHTRGQFRRLCAALGVELKEGEQ
jgi:hypothetical protein